MARAKKHLTQSDRIQIEIGLGEHKSFKTIAKEVNKNCTTISREVRAHKVALQKGAYGRKFNDCLNRFKCNKYEQCNDDKCYKKCSTCGICIKFCLDYEKEYCPKLLKAPYVCNGCKQRGKCTLEKQVYQADYAYKQYKEVLVRERTGVNLESKQLDFLNELIPPLLKAGQSIHHVYVNNKESIMCSERSIYRYVKEHTLVDSSPLDLRIMPKMKPRRKGNSRQHKVEAECRLNRTFKDFKNYVVENGGSIPEVQMDTVEGVKGGKVLLTLHFTNCNLMLAFIRDRNDAKSVIEIFDYLYALLGRADFMMLFKVILTDRGTEFSAPSKIEVGFDGIQRTKGQWIFWGDLEFRHKDINK